MPSEIVRAPEQDFATPGILRPRPLLSWLTVELGILFVLLCWSVLYFWIRPGAPFHGQIFIEADSSTYFILAGVANADSEDPQAETSVPLVAFNGNLLGPVYVAKIFRTQTNVTIFNAFLLVFMVAMAGGIPGVRRRVFLALFIINAQSLVAIATLNKEIFAAVGLVAFMRYYFSPKKPWFFLGVAILFSLMARWEQLAVVLFFLGMKSRISPFRHNNKAGILAMILGIGLAYPVLLRTRGGQLAAFMISSNTAGTVARLDWLQGHFAFPLIFWVKILMNLFDRWLTPWYFLTSAFWDKPFNYLQTELIVPLQALATLVLSVAIVKQGRFRLERTIPYFIALYLVATAVNPFIQPRYEFPVYALMCLELARRGDSPEPLRKSERWKFRLLSPDPREPLLPRPKQPGVPA